MKIIFRAVAALLPLLLVACFSQSSAPSTAPTLISVTPGEGRAIVSWTGDPGLTYWVYYKNETDDPASGPVSKSNYTGIVSSFTGSVRGLINGKVYWSGSIGGLINGKTYSFLVTTSDNTSKTGPVSAVMTAKPDLLINSDAAWTLSANPNPSNNLRGIAYGNNYYAMVGNSGTVLTATHNYPIPGGVTTTDTTGTTSYGLNNSGWIPSTGVGASTNYSAVIYNGSGFVALGEDGSTIYSSATTTWTLGTPGTPVPVPVVWTAGTSINATPNTMNALALGGVYVAVGNGGKIFTAPSITGTWTPVANSNTTQNLYGVSYLNGIYIAVGAQGTLITSTDGVNWSLPQNTHTAYDLHQVAFALSTYVKDGISKYVAVGDAGTIISSTDTITWSQPHTSGTTQNLRAICFGPAAGFITSTTPLPNAQFIVVGAAGTVLYSETGADTTWTTSTTVPGLVGGNDLSSIVPTDVLIAVGTAGTIVSAP